MRAGRATPGIDTGCRKKCHVDHKLIEHFQPRGTGKARRCWVVKTTEHNKANVGFSHQTIGDIHGVTDRRYVNLVWEEIDQIG